MHSISINRKCKFILEENERILTTSSTELEAVINTLVNHEAHMRDRNVCIISEAYWDRGAEIGARIYNFASNGLTEAIQYFEQIDLQNKYMQEVQKQGDFICPKCKQKSVVLQLETTPKHPVTAGTVIMIIILILIPLAGWIALFVMSCCSDKPFATYGICKNCGYHYRHH